MIKTALVAGLFTVTLAAAAPAAAETVSTPFGDVTADQDVSFTTPSYRYEVGYTDPTGTVSWGGWSEGRPDYGLHSDVRVAVNGVEVGNHQHYGYRDLLIENNFDAGDLRTEQSISNEGTYSGAVFYNGECVYGCPD